MCPCYSSPINTQAGGVRGETGLGGSRPGPNLIQWYFPVSLPKATLQLSACLCACVCVCVCVFNQRYCSTKTLASGPSEK